MSTEWRNHAACLGLTDLFDADYSDTMNAEAKAICAGCKVWEQCHHWIMSTRPDPCPTMIVAGLSPAERGRVRRRRCSVRGCSRRAGAEGLCVDHNGALVEAGR